MAKAKAAKRGSGRKRAAVQATAQAPARHERRGDAGAFLTIRLDRGLRDAATARADGLGLDLSFAVRELLRSFAAGDLDVRVSVVRHE